MRIVVNIIIRNMMFGDSRAASGVECSDRDIESNHYGTQPDNRLTRTTMCDTMAWSNAQTRSVNYLPLLSQ